MLSMLLIQNTLFAQNSPLAEGDWVKIAVIEEGVYRLTTEDLQQMGFNTANIDPRNIQLWGNGGGMLPQGNNVPRPAGLQQNSIRVVGEADGQWNQGDYILFYGQSADAPWWSGDGDSLQYEHNIYSDTAFYFLTVATENGKRIAQSGFQAQGTDIHRSFRAFYTYEKDLVNILSSGRMWFGETFSASGERSRNFNIPTPGRQSGNVSVKSVVVGRSPAGTSFNLSLNGSTLGTQDTPSYPDQTYGDKGSLAEDIFEINGTEGTELTLRYEYNGPSGSIGNLDYFTVEYPASLVWQNNQLMFSNVSEAGGLNMGVFELGQSPQNLNVWHMADVLNPVSLEISVVGSGSRFLLQESEATRLVAFTPETTKRPVSFQSIANQNLWATHGADAIFVSHPSFIEEARRLADFRTTNDGLQVEVVTPGQIYNDFSSGKQDITAIRDYVRHQYLSGGKQLKYLLLFGDASFDYKKRLIVDHNFVPVYESRESLDRLFSHSSDDYYGFMDDDEGEWEERFDVNYQMEVGVGRLVVKSKQEAFDLVNKIIRYSSSATSLGEWRKRIYFLADDGDFNIHLRHAEQLANYMDTAQSQYNIQKIYVDAFPQVTEGGNKSVPEATRTLKNAINEGAFIINFTGHGNESKWTEEDLFVEQMIGDFTNRVRLPLLVTATCEFGNYDNPLRFSGGEQILLYPDGGAIALITTTRPVTSNTNLPVNQAFYEHAFTKIEGQHPRLGDIMKVTKNNSLAGPINRNFALLGDPTMQLAYPEYEIELTNSAGMPFEHDTIKALGRYSLSGQITDLSGNRIPGFNGTLQLSVLDKPLEISTLGDENPVTTFLSRNSLLFKGEVTVSQGRFDLEFVVPKNISYKMGRGKVAMYAISEDLQVDAMGAEVDLFVGGSETNVPEDNTPPEVSLFLNDSSFVSGQSVPNNPMLLMGISDENGITLSRTGIGQQMQAILDDEIAIPLSDFYIAAKDDFSRGMVRYPLGELEEGYHTLTTKVWDTHNNSTTTTVEFYVGNTAGITISSLQNYPNPMQNQTTFSFTHDRPGEALNVDLNIFSLSGEKVFGQSYFFDEAPQSIDEIAWDGNYENGGSVVNGIYIYEISIRSSTDGVKTKAYKKLIIVN